jgi:hypothetical protein
VRRRKLSLTVLCGGEGRAFMSGGILLINNDGRLGEMNEEAYDSEDVSQWVGREKAKASALVQKIFKLL